MSNTDQNSPLWPPPPRLTGDYKSDAVTLADYLSDFYQAVVAAPPAAIDPNNLPDPANATIASAQLTANIAYQFAAAVNSALATFALAINAELKTDSIANFPLTPNPDVPIAPPTTET